MENQIKAPKIGSTVAFYTYAKEGEKDTGDVVKIIENDSDKSDPIIEIKPILMGYDKVYRTVSELIFD